MNSRTFVLGVELVDTQGYHKCLIIENQSTYVNMILYYSFEGEVVMMGLHV